MGFLRLIFENSFFPLCLKWLGILREKMCNRRLDCVVRKIMPAPDSFVLRNQTKLSFFCVHSPHRVPLSPGCTFILGKKTIAWENGKILNNIKLSPEVPSLFFWGQVDLLVYEISIRCSLWLEWVEGEGVGGVLYVPNLWFLLADPPFASPSGWPSLD